MTLISLEIESYQVSVRNFRWIEPVPAEFERRRKIHLVSKMQFHGIRTMIELDFNSGDLPSVIGLVTTNNYLQHNLFAKLPLGEFDEYYNILLNHANVFASFETGTENAYDASTSTATSPIIWFQLSTEPSTIGGSIDIFSNLLRKDLPEFAEN